MRHLKLHIILIAVLCLFTGATALGQDSLYRALREGETEAEAINYAEAIRQALDNKAIFSALALAEEMSKIADERQDTSEIWESYKCMGDIYFHGGDFSKAREYRRKAIAYSVNVPDQASARLYMDMADTFEERDSVHFYLKLMGENLRTGCDSSLFYARMALFHAENNSKEFARFYKEYKNSSYDPVSAKMAAELEIYDLINRGKLDQAEKRCASFKDNVSRYDFLEKIAILKNDTDAAYRYAKAKIALMEESASESRLKEMGEIEKNLKIRNEARAAGMNSLKATRIQARAKANGYISVILGILLILSILIIMSISLYYRQKQMATSQKNAEEQQKKLAEEKSKAEHASEMKSMYLQNMSHEIRTPLNAIVGFSQILGMPDDFTSPEEKSKYLEYILNSANILNMHIDDILNISDIESGNYTINIEKCMVNDICRLSMKSVEYRVRSGVDLQFSTELPDDLWCMTDSRRVQQVLINFLSNACKHTDQGEIHVHTCMSEDGRFVKVSVTDTGEGIPEDKREDIFSRFVKLNNLKEGTGLGLNICKGISKRLGGNVYLDPDYTTGCRFVFMFPYNI